MFCSKCGQELPSEANFCWKCGQRVQKPGDTADSAGYEHCLVKWALNGRICEAWVGNAVIASVSVKPESISDHIKACFLMDSSGYERHAREKELAEVELVSQLVSQGWEPFPLSQEQVKTLRRAI